jgi:hypothetical protein
MCGYYQTHPKGLNILWGSPHSFCVKKKVLIYIDYYPRLCWGAAGAYQI